MFLAVALAYDIEEYKPEPCRIKDFLAVGMDEDYARYIYELISDDPSEEDFYRFWDDIENVYYATKRDIEEGRPLSFRDGLFFSEGYGTINDSNNSKKIYGTLENFEYFITEKCKNEKILDLVKGKMPEAVAKAKERLRKEHTKE